MLLMRKKEEAGKQAESGIGREEGHRGLPGSRGRRARLWTVEAVGAGRSNGTNEGGGCRGSGGGSGGEILARRSRPRGPASSGVAARASRQGPIAAETNSDTKARPRSRRGVDPAQTPTG